MTKLRPSGLARDCRGVAVIELALLAPVLALTIIGIVDVSNAYSRKLAIEQGAHRAIELIMQSTRDDTVEGSLKSEVVCQVNGVDGDGGCKTTPITESNVTVTFRLECRDSAGVISSTQTSTDSTAFDALTCNSGLKEARYIEVHVTDKYTPLFPVHFAGFNSDGTYHVSATAGVRTQ